MRQRDSTETGTTHDEATFVGRVDVQDAGDVPAHRVAWKDVLAHVARRAVPVSHHPPVVVGDLELLHAVHVDGVLEEYARGHIPPIM